MGIITYSNLSVYHYRKRKDIRTMVIYAVWIEVDKGEFDYVRESRNGHWSDSSPVKLFDTKEAAREEADRWNTGEVVEYVRQQPTT